MCVFVWVLYEFAKKKKCLRWFARKTVCFSGSYSSRCSLSSLFLFCMLFWMHLPPSLSLSIHIYSFYTVMSRNDATIFFFNFAHSTFLLPWKLVREMVLLIHAFLSKIISNFIFSSSSHCYTYFHLLTCLLYLFVCLFWLVL